MREDIKPGNNFPDYELPDHTDTPRKLSFLQGDDPVILSICRGVFCPKDRVFLHEFVRFAPRAMVGYVSLVTLTTDDLIGSNELRQGVNAHWPFLRDEERRVQKDLDIQEYTDQKHDPMIPYVIVLEPGLKIYKVYNEYWYWGRPSMHELHMDLKDISKRHRPDWKIDTPEMRKKWEKGEKEHFWPFGKDFKQELKRMTWEH